MTYTFALDGAADAKSIALIRDEIDDVSPVAGGGIEGKDYFVSDERILTRLQNLEAPADATDGEKRLLTAASLLDTLATNQAYVLKKQRTLSQEMDGPAVAKEIRAHAAALRTRAAKTLQDRREEATAAGQTLSEPLGGAIDLVPVIST